MSRDRNPLEDLARLAGVEPHTFDASSDECRACEHFAECETKHKAKQGAQPSNDNAQAPAHTNVLPLPVDPNKPAARSLRPPPLTPEEFYMISVNPTHGMASFLIGRLITRKEAGMEAIDFDMGVEAIRFSLRDRVQ